MRRRMMRGMVLTAAAAWLGAVGLWAESYRPIGFEQLAAMSYEPAEPTERTGKVVRKEPEYLEQYVLGSVLAMDGKAVEIAGYMLPLSTKGQKVDEFLLMPDTGACCYGEMPAFNGFVYARARDGANLLDNIPIRIRGTLSVEEVWQNGFFSHLYYVEVDEVVAGSGAMPGQPQISW